MRITNRHEQAYPLPDNVVGGLLDGLGSSQDRLWPRRDWPPMFLEDGLRAGSRGGHGPVRYVVEVYHPGRSVIFRFTRPRGWAGTHAFVAEPISEERTRLWHVLEMEATGLGLLAWFFVFRPLHNALIREALHQVGQVADGSVSAPKRTRYVRLLRWILRPKA